MERARYLDADDLPERQPRREQHRAPHPRPEIDERRALERKRDVRDQRLEIADRRRLVVGRMGDIRPDGFRIQIAEKQQRLGRDPVLRIEPLPGGPAGNARYQPAFQPSSRR